MGVNLDISEKLQSYISNFSLKLNPVQLEIINYNKTLGDIKRMQIDPTQCHFLHLIIKISNIKNVLEIGHFYRSKCSVNFFSVTRRWKIDYIR
jgi:caffeoyl-CoA O-methyltransferase